MAGSEQEDFKRNWFQAAIYACRRARNYNNTGINLCLEKIICSTYFTALCYVALDLCSLFLPNFPWLCSCLREKRRKLREKKWLKCQRVTAIGRRVGVGGKLDFLLTEKENRGNHFGFLKSPVERKLPFVAY